jgi:ribonuclease R
MLEQAKALAEALRKRRMERGSLDFNVPEAQILFDDHGSIIGVTARETGVANGIIEECMLAANEAVARFLLDSGEHALYRVHPAPEPEKLEGLFETLVATGLSQRIKRAGPAALQALLAAPSDERQAFIIRRLALRAMMQARYSPELEGHFGLASDCYCHFTSPIRRYADLTVHRCLRKALGLPTYGNLPGPAKMERIAQDINTRERAAIEAEREITRRLTVLFLSEKIGETYSGIISGVLDFGFFVELRGVMAEGMVRLSSLPDDYFGFDPTRQELLGERTGRAFRLGQEVTVIVQEVSMGRLEINLALAGQALETGRKRRGPSPGKNRPGEKHLRGRRFRLRP